MAASLPSTDRFYELDACRGIAAMAVVVAHLTLHYDIIFGFRSLSLDAESHQRLVFLVSRVPVYFFFVISGYVISLSLNNVATIREFIAFRFARLFPAYWIAVCLTSFALVIFPDAGDAPSGSTLAANLTMVQTALGNRNIDPVYWSLAHELSFYALIAFVFSVVRYSNRSLIAFSVLWLTVSASAFALSPAVVKDSAVASGLLEYTPFFTGGIAFYLRRSGERGRLVNALMLASLALASIRIQAFGVVSAAAIFLVFHFVSSGQVRWIANWFTIHLGRISYPLYLFHLAPGFIMINALENAGLPSAPSVVVAVLGVVVSAQLIHILIESPARRWIRGLVRRPTLSQFAADAGKPLAPSRL